MASVEHLLARAGVHFSPLLDDESKKDIISFLESVESDRGEISDAELDSIIAMYVGFGLLVRDGDTQDPGQIEKAQTEIRHMKANQVKTSPELPASEDTSDPESPSYEAPKETPAADPVITYQFLYTAGKTATVEDPILILDNSEGFLLHHKSGAFMNPQRRTAFEYRAGEEDHLHRADILFLNRRFIKMLDWLGENHIYVRLSGRPTDRGFSVYKIHAKDPNGNDTLQSANDSFLQLMIRRLLAAGIPHTDPFAKEEETEETDDHMLLTDMASIIDFLHCISETLPPDILSWAHRNIALIKTDTIGADEKRHARRALSMMMNIRWEDDYFEAIDPKEARRILDEELYGMDRVKQRVIETIIQINRTHTLPAYGLLLVGPAGTGKSQIAYAVARILKLPWAALDMSTIHDSEALTGSPRVYTNAKPGKIMESFYRAGSSNIVFIINELDKAEGSGSGGNPADALLTLLDNLGYTDNYIECVIPTHGVYPIATANDKNSISAPLLSRFAVIEISDYTADEKAEIFRHFSLPKIMKRMGIESRELQVTDEAVRYIVRRYEGVPGVRDLEQAAEHIAANALYRIETTGTEPIIYDEEMVRELLAD